MTKLRAIYPCCSKSCRLAFYDKPLTKVHRVHYCAPEDEIGTAYLITIKKIPIKSLGAMWAIGFLDKNTTEYKKQFGHKVRPTRKLNK